MALGDFLFGIWICILLLYWNFSSVLTFIQMINILRRPAQSTMVIMPMGMMPIWFQPTMPAAPFGAS
jgi:hypothetical protein